jgi:hypothetical protein
MIEFMKANPWTFAVAGVILTGAIVGVIIGMVTKGGWRRSGLLRRGGKDLRWAKDVFPIPVFYHRSLPLSAAAAFDVWANKLAKAVGKRLFMRSEPAPIGWQTEQWPPYGTVFVQPADEPTVEDDVIDDKVGGWTRLRWEKETGAIRAAIVGLVLDGPLLLERTGHEVGHTLGLDHTESRTLMYHQLALTATGVEFSDENSELLKKEYT